MPFGERKRKVVEEEKYVSDLEFIIKRDFFPHSEAIELNLKYFDALDKQDFTSLKEVQTKLNLINASFKKCHPKFNFTEIDIGAPYKNPSMKEERDLSLDEYLARNTSEDNDSFRELQQQTIDRQLKKFESSVKQARDYYNNINAIENNSEILAIEGVNIPNDNYHGEYRETFQDVRIFNQVFFTPDNAALSAQEKINLSGKKSQMNYDVFKLPLNNTKRRSNAASTLPKKTHGKIGPDGKEIIEQIIPEPSIPDRTPDLTWGEIDGTPQLLSESPKLSRFYIPQPSHSETLANKLANRISEKKRANKKAERARVRNAFSIRSGSSTRLTAAGMKLLSRMTPSLRPDVTSRSSLNTPSTRIRATPGSNTITSGHRNNITDDLLGDINLL